VGLKRIDGLTKGEGPLRFRETFLKKKEGGGGKRFIEKSMNWEDAKCRSPQKGE